MREGKMISLVRAMFRKEKAIWRCWGEDGAGKLAEVEQAEREFEEMGRRPMNKYGNRKTVCNGITFDSAKEAARYGELMLMLRAGEIKELRLQPEFTLQQAFITPEGERVRAVRYRADFSYKKRVKEGPDTYWVEIIEDVKGYRTREYETKKTLMNGKGLHVREV